MSSIIITQRLSNGQVRHHSFESATVHLKQPFVVVHYDIGSTAREDWFAVGSVMRVEVCEDDN